MKKISILLFSLFILVTTLFVWEKYLPKKYSILSFHYKFKNNETVVTQKAKTVTKVDMTKKTIPTKGIVYAEIVKNPETGVEEVKVHLPPGKRLYNEEKMNEIASSANIETLTNE